MSSQANLVSL
jgi:hypothetical protein